MSTAPTSPSPPPRAKPPAIRRDWTAKTLAGMLLGLSLALGTSALLDRALAGVGLAARAQLVMWAVPPVWFGVLGLCFLFGSGARAWAWLAAANAGVFGLWAVLRQL